MSRLRGANFAMVWMVAGCHASRPVTAPPPAVVQPAAGGLAVSLTFTPPAHVAVFEWRPGGFLERISPTGETPFASLTLTTPGGLSAEPRGARFAPRILVTTPSGWEQPLGVARTWNSSRVVWIPQAAEPGRTVPSRATLWFVVWLRGPFIPALDAAARTVDLPCCATATALAADVAAAFGVSVAQVWALAPD